MLQYLMESRISNHRTHNWIVCKTYYRYERTEQSRL